MVLLSLTALYRFYRRPSARKKVEGFTGKGGDGGEGDGGAGGGVTIVNSKELASQPGLAEYFARFNRFDCGARGCPTPEKCMAAYVAAVVPRGAIPSKMRAALVRDAAKADERLRRTAPHLLTVPWHVAILYDTAENGWPHTHGGVICLPVNHFQQAEAKRVETLIHERVHVHQRSRGSWKKGVPMPAKVAERARSNPDLDGHLYPDAHTGHACVTLYATTTPTSLRDVRTAVLDTATWQEVHYADADACAYEHPFEEEAYKTASEL
jgi:hypothetical protein